MLNQPNDHQFKNTQLALDDQTGQVASNTISLTSIVKEARKDSIDYSKIAGINFCITTKSKQQKFSDWKNQTYAQWKTAIKDLLGNDVNANIKKLQTAALLTLFVNLKISEIKAEDAQAIFDICEYYLGTKDASNIDLLRPISSAQELDERITNLATYIFCLINNLKEAFLLFQTGWIRLLANAEAKMLVEQAKIQGIEGAFIIHASYAEPSQLTLTYFNSSSGNVEHRYFNQEFATKIADENDATISVIDKFPTILHQYKFGNKTFPLLEKFIDLDDFKFNFCLLTSELLSYLILCGHSEISLKTLATSCEIPLQEITKEAFKLKADSAFSTAYSLLSQATQGTAEPTKIETTISDNNHLTPAIPPVQTSPSQTLQPGLYTTQNSYPQPAFLFFSSQESYLQNLSDVTFEQKQKALRDLEADLAAINAMSAIHHLFLEISKDKNILRQHRENYIFSSGNTDSYKKAIQLILGRINVITTQSLANFADFQYMLDILKAGVHCKLIDSKEIISYKKNALQRLKIELAYNFTLAEINGYLTQITAHEHFLRYERSNYLHTYGNTDSYAAAILAIAQRVVSHITIYQRENDRTILQNIKCKFDECYKHHSKDPEWASAYNELHQKYENNFGQKIVKQQN